MGLLRLDMRWCLVLAGGAAMVLLALEGGRLETDPIFAIIRCVFSFFLGAWAASLHVRVPRKAATPIAGSALALVVAAIWGLGGTHAEILLPPLFALTIVAVASLEADTSLRRFEWPYFVWLGTVSYSVYLTHSIIGWGVTQVLRFGLKVPTQIAPDGDTVLALGQGFATFVTLAATAAVLVASYLTYRFIEKPFLSGWPFGSRAVAPRNG